MRTLEQIKKQINSTKNVTMTDRHGQYIYKNGVTEIYGNRLEAEHYAFSLGYKLSEVKIKRAK